MKELLAKLIALDNHVRVKNNVPIPKVEDFTLIGS